MELIPTEAAAARARVGDQAQVVVGDFFEWLQSIEAGSFDVVVGNPPFIRYQNFAEPSRTLAMEFLRRQGLRPNKLTNIWVPFVVAGVHLLAEGGRLGMIVPAELLQVTYAGQLRRYLADAFRRVTIFTCNEAFFDGAEQEVVILAAEGKLPTPDARHRCHIEFVEAPDIASLLQRRPRTTRRVRGAKYVEHDSEKWLKYFLDAREIELMRSLRVHPELTTLGNLGTVDVGVVTGKNEFFVLSEPEVKRYGLEAYVIPLVGRSAQLPGAVLRSADYSGLASTGKDVFLLHLRGHPPKLFPTGLREYIAAGERENHHLGYKCRIRDPWYNVPAVWAPDCFLFRQIYDFPRVVVNEVGATSTDTIHRIRCQGPPARFAPCLYTHLTAASAEIEGRSYGGGVLELEPTEAERLLVAHCPDASMPIAEVDRLVRAGRLEEVLAHNAEHVLRGRLGLRAVDCAALKHIWVKMRDRRKSRQRGAS